MKTIHVSDNTYEKIKDQILEEEQVDVSSYQDFVGKNWLIKTVTCYYVGEAVKVVGNLIQLRNASWVADTGRFMDAIKDGVLSEVEPIHASCFVNINASVNIIQWKHKLPTEQK